MRRISSLFCVLVLSSALAACQQGTGMGMKEGAGTLGGAVLGGLAGSQVGGGSGRLWATGAGVLLGAFIGNEIGSSLDKADRAYAANAMTRAHDARLGQPVSWHNPDSGNAGTITAVRDGRSVSGDYCREYKTTILVDGRQETAFGTACQAPDGSWRIAS